MREHRPAASSGDELRVSLPATLSAPATARRQVATAGLVPHTALDDVLLLASELVTNSVRHAQTDPGDRIELTLTRRDARVRVEVADQGMFFDNQPKAEGEAGGLGLLLVDRLASRWGIERRRGRGTRVWFECDVAPGLHG